MRLSELVARCRGTDPELAVTDGVGTPQPIVDIDHAASKVGVVVVLTPARREDDW